MIRQAVEAYLEQPVKQDVKHLPADEVAWQEILASFEEVRNQNFADAPIRWNREDFYDDPRYQRNWSKQG